MREIKKHVLTVFFCLSLGVINGQENAGLQFDFPDHNALKFNRFLMNPTFSYVGEEHSYINFFHRNQWLQFDDSPRTYMVNYSGKIDERSGAGLGLYQQRLGVFTKFGALANYAYNVNFTENTSLTFGFNFAYSSTGIDAGSALPGESDPVLQGIASNSFLSLQPGINLTLYRFDIGVYTENLVVYNLKENVLSYNNLGQAFSGHIRYTKVLENSSGLFEEAKFSILARGKIAKEKDLNLSASSILDMPKLGWIQAGYDDFYGMSAGIGFNLSGHLSIGYTYEKGSKNALSTFGSTHEIVLAYSFKGTRRSSQNDPIQKKEQLPRKEKLERKVRSNKKRSDSEQEETKIAAIPSYENMKIKPKAAQTSEQIFDSQILNIDYQETNDKYSFLFDRVKKQEPRKVASTTKGVSKESFKTIKKQNFEGVEGGYYIIGNVYENKSNLDYFLGVLEDKGIVSASYFTDSKTDLKYAYLKRYDTLEEAQAAYQSNMDNYYDGPMWILHVDKSL